MDGNTATPRPPHDEEVLSGHEPPPPLEADQPDPFDPLTDVEVDFPPGEDLEPL